MPNASFGFGSLLIDDFCIEHPDEVLQLSKKLYQYGESKNSRMFFFIFLSFIKFFFIKKLNFISLPFRNDIGTK
jgi:hypothetical protein